MARVSSGSATRFLFVAVGVVRRLAVGLPLFAALLCTFRLLLVVLCGLSGCCCAAMIVLSPGSVASTVVAAPGFWCPAHVTRGNECVVLGVWCLCARNLRLVSCVSRSGAGIPALCAAAFSSVQHSSPQTMASCCLRGKTGVGLRQLACHTILHRVHSVSVPPLSHTSHWSFLSPSQCSVYSCVRQSLAIICLVPVHVVSLTLRFPCRRWLVSFCPSCIVGGVVWCV